MKPKEVFELEETSTNFVHPASDVLGVAVEGLTGLVQGLEPKQIRPFLNFDTFFKQLYLLSEFCFDGIYSSLIEVFFQDIQLKLQFLLYL